MDKKTIIMGGVILILAIALLVFLVGIPQYNKFIKNSYNSYQKTLFNSIIDSLNQNPTSAIPLSGDHNNTAKIVNVNTLIDVADSQGYIQLLGDHKSIILIKYIPKQ